MDRQTFKQAYNQQVDRLKGEASKLKVLGVVKQDGDAAVFNTATPGINILHFAKEQASGVIVSGHQSPEGASLAMLSYALCLDATCS